MEEVTTVSQSETILPLAEVAVPVSDEWNVLEKSDMVAFAKGEVNMNYMREDEWKVDSENIPPSYRYPGWDTDAGGRTDGIIRPDIQAHEVLHLLGLLMARMRSPRRRRFSTIVSLQRKVLYLVPIMANLHFTNNTDVRDATDRTWAISSVVETLQHTYPAGYKTPPVISFDEDILPSKNRNNPHGTT
ncbi:hypothetical protein PHMEG_0003125 [Phytophthora megakarya]|uniref:PiggyBac transposable element-derived protein domain-containing protein n=1 Tax=Phytophthora megakarya TaxID=4795 RepID=A0A225WXI7_9STRA|nr:hypothetical protein PHMEG_0003125 [Phytophthora megakarya]